MLSTSSLSMDEVSKADTVICCVTAQLDKRYLFVTTTITSPVPEKDKILRDDVIKWKHLQPYWPFV